MPPVTTMTSATSGGGTSAGSMMATHSAINDVPRMPVSRSAKTVLNARAPPLSGARSIIFTTSPPMPVGKNVLKNVPAMYR